MVPYYLHMEILSCWPSRHVWHIDDNHCVRSWRFVIHGGVGRYSRYWYICIAPPITKLQQSFFISAVDQYGPALRVRADAGFENYQGSHTFSMSK